MTKIVWIVVCKNFIAAPIITLSAAAPTPIPENNSESTIDLFLIFIIFLANKIIYQHLYQKIALKA
jgi:hypothetical protein